MVRGIKKTPLVVVIESLMHPKGIDYDYDDESEEEKGAGGANSRLHGVVNYHRPHFHNQPQRSVAVCCLAYNREPEIAPLCVWMHTLCV